MRGRRNQRTIIKEEEREYVCIYNFHSHSQAVNIWPPLLVCDSVTNMSLALSIVFFSLRM